MTTKIEYHVRFNPNTYEASAYSIWKGEKLVAAALNEIDARKLYNELNRLPQML